ncbi:insulinase family protein [Phytoactinopolyspora limicola]|uniref:insulinase family protein n=1 Tax=Phytoactinopolyspora limicola TaxID=2715536 RepID=UPI00140B1A87|nr:insulinase family protein [Phytoactinopolyspora limicola]
MRKARAAYEAGQAAAATNNQAASTDETTSGERYTANLTDPDSRLLKTRNGWIQGYNCQITNSDDGSIFTVRATTDANDVEQLIPAMNEVSATAQALADRTGREDLRQVGTIIADAGYDCDDNLTAAGPDRLIADGKRHTIDQPPFPKNNRLYSEENPPLSHRKPSTVTQPTPDGSPRRHETCP